MKLITCLQALGGLVGALLGPSRRYLGHFGPTWTHQMSAEGGVGGKQSLKKRLQKAGGGGKQSLLKVGAVSAVCGTTA